MIEIDGASGEGGGQVLRTSLALSVVTGKPISIFNIRAGRAKPGLQAQHLASVRAAREVCNGGVTGAQVGSTEINFSPGAVRPGSYRFDVGTAGSTSLVLQTVLYPLLTAGGDSEVVITGGTHNTHAPPHDFLARAFAPLLAEMGPSLTVELEACGFYPVGGGRVRATIKPADWKPLALADLASATWWVNALVCRLPDGVAVREIAIAREALGIPHQRAVLRNVEGAGPGNAITIFADCGRYMEVFTGFGGRGKRAEDVAAEAVREAMEWRDIGAPVGPHLADQLLLPMALGAGGTFVTGPLSGHTKTNVETIRRFLDVSIEVDALGSRRNRITVKPATS